VNDKVGMLSPQHEPANVLEHTVAHTKLSDYVHMYAYVYHLTGQSIMIRNRHDIGIRKCKEMQGLGKPNLTRLCIWIQLSNLIRD